MGLIVPTEHVTLAYRYSCFVKKSYSTTLLASSSTTSSLHVHILGKITLLLSTVPTALSTTVEAVEVVAS